MILYVFHTTFSAFVRSRPAQNPVLLLSVCSGAISARCSVRFRSTGPRVQYFSSHRTSTPTLRYPFPIITHLVLFAVQSFRFRERSPTFLLDSRCLDLTFATFDFESTPSGCFAVPFVRSARHSAHFCPRPHRLDVKFRDHHARSVSLTALHFMSTPPTEPESPPRTVSSRTRPLVYAEVFSISKKQ